MALQCAGHRLQKGVPAAASGRAAAITASSSESDRRMGGMGGDLHRLRETEKCAKVIRAANIKAE
jgi:hypothetical protein